MSEPIFFISRNKVKEGKLEEYRQLALTVAQRLEDELHCTVASNFYLSEDCSEAINVYLFSDAAAMDSHVQAARAWAAPTFELIEAQGIEIYGQPSAQTLEMMRQMAGPEITLRLFPEYVGGYVRFPSG